MQFDFNFEPDMIWRIAYVTHMAKERNYVHHSHVHNADAHELIYVDYGKLQVTIADETFHLNAGDSMLIPGGSIHAMEGDGGSPFDYLNILFRGQLPADILGCLLPNTRQTVEILQHLKRESEEQLPRYQTFAYCLLAQLLILYMRHQEMSVPSSLPEAATQRHYQSESVNRALSVIAQEYDSPLTLEQLSESVGISQSYLRVLIKKETGQTFSDLLQKQRVSVAKHLLRESQYTLTQIANAVGYQSMPFFFKVFKRWTGMTPMDYSRSLGDPAGSMPY